MTVRYDVGSFGSPEKKISINFTKANTKYSLSLHYNADNSYLFINRKETIKLKTREISREIFLNGNVYDFSVDYNYIDKSHILNIHKYLMTKNNIR